MSQIKNNTGVTVAMLRAFVSLSKTLNLTETTKLLGATRQTIRRRITDLEMIRGQALFSLEKQEYILTAYGKGSVVDAESILKQLESWSTRSRMTKLNSQWLESANYVDPSGREFFSQQQPISRIAKNGLPMMKKTLAAWGQAHTQIEDSAMADVRPYLVIYRKSQTGWVCVEIGERSAYAKWFGWAWSKSAIGRLSEEDKAGDDFNEFISGAYVRIYGEGGVRLDHLYAHLLRESSDEPIPVSFQRLLMGCVFPDGTSGLAVLVLMTNQIDIDALHDVKVSCVPEELVMDFEV